MLLLSIRLQTLHNSIPPIDQIPSNRYHQTETANELETPGTRCCGCGSRRNADDRNARARGRTARLRRFDRKGLWRVSSESGRRRPPERFRRGVCRERPQAASEEVSQRSRAAALSSTGESACGAAQNRLAMSGDGWRQKSGLPDRKVIAKSGAR